MAAYVTPNLCNERINIIFDGKYNIHEIFHDFVKLYHYSLIEAVDGNTYVLRDLTVRGIKYNKIYIIDKILNRLSSYYRAADVIIEAFSIHDPDTLRYVIHDGIPRIHTFDRRTPILLVGFDTDLGRHCSGHFPSASGPLLAECVGAVKYVECSAINKFYAYKILEEAVCAALLILDLEQLDYEPHSILMDHASIDSQWISVMKEADIAESCPTFASQLEEYLNFMGKQNEVPLQLDTVLYEDFFMCQCLEIERNRLSHKQDECFHTNTESLHPRCTLWYIPDCRKKTEVSSICQSTRAERLPCETEDVSRKKDDPVNLLFCKQTCKSIMDFFSKIGSLLIRSLVIVECTGILNFSLLANLTGLEYLVIVNSKVNITSLTFPSHFRNTMKHLVLNNCGITEEIDVPSVIGELKNLQLLNVADNNFQILPNTLSPLQKLHTLLLDQHKMVFPPPGVLSKPAQDVISFLEATQKDVIENKEAKLIVTGQEGVGKSTLIKAMKRNIWLTKTKLPNKTDGIDISDLELDGIKCKVYDLAGDVEYLNTHFLFISSNCLHLAVFDLSQFIVSKGTRSADNLCRLELWLQTIASQDPKSFVIIVGTHADHPLINRDILQKTRELVVQLLAKYLSTHVGSFQSKPCDGCMICNQDKVPIDLKCCWPSDGSETLKKDTNGEVDVTCIPHIVGYFEVSGIMKYPSSYTSISNINLKKLKYSMASSISNLMKITSTETIPRKWLSFRETIGQMLSTDHDLKQQPLMSLSVVHDLALKCEIFSKNTVIAMLRFFHSQGTFLWYEDLPEMKAVVVIDPQWLSDQLITLISYRSSVSNFICNAVISLSDLPALWANIYKENHSKLLCLFRSVGLCFSISDTEELFPCNLPVGWPSEDMWSPLPSPSEKQTSLLFLFSFVPPSFFPDLIVKANEESGSFAGNVQPLYYRFHIVYILKDQEFSENGEETCLKIVTGEHVRIKAEKSKVLHRVHYELMPHNNSLKVAIRGPCPRSIIPHVRSMIETVKSRRYPGITYFERLLCPECVMKKARNQATFVLDAYHDGVCSRGHEVGNTEDILDGKLSSSIIVPSAVHQAGKVVGETLQDNFCPKVFVVLPINLESVSLKDLFVFSYLRDGFAVHLLCECPDQWHFIDSPGFRIGKPKEFFEKYGSRVCKVLRVIATLCIPFKAASTLGPHCEIGAAVGVGTTAVCKELESLLESYLDKYPYLRSTFGSSNGCSNDDLEYLKSSTGLQRSELARFLEMEAKGHNFGPLVCTYVQKYNEWLWLCEVHNKRFKIVERD